MGSSTWRTMSSSACVTEMSASATSSVAVVAPPVVAPPAVAPPAVAVKKQRKTKKAADVVEVSSASSVAPPAVTVKKQRKTKKVVDSSECDVCCTAFNKSTKKQVVCPASECAYSACSTCVRRYLLDNPLSAPHCMACKKQFSRLFVVEKLTKTWTNDTYLPEISKVQVDVELSKLAESMEEAENRKQIAENKKTLEKLNEEFKEDALQWRRDREIYQEIRFQYSIRRLRLLKENARLSKNKEEERKTFTMPCAYNNCNGMLSSQYKCGICDKYTCKDCHEPLEEEHKCNPDNVATTQAIKKDTRPCPSCNTRIYKIEGCDQMWCTSCKTPFSWTTGKMVKAGERIHNPHAIEFFKQNGGGGMIRAPGDLVCGGLISNGELKYILDIMKVGAISSNTMLVLGHLIMSYKIVDDVSRNYLRVSREISQAHYDFNEERVKYILKDIDKDKFASIVKHKNNNKNVHMEVSFILELVSTFGIEMFKLLSDMAMNKKIEVMQLYQLTCQKLTEFSTLVKYVNLQMAQVSVAHNCNVMIIGFSFDVSNLRNVKDMINFSSKKFSTKRLNQLNV